MTTQTFSSWLLSLGVASPLGAGDSSIVIQGGAPKQLPAQSSSRGKRAAKDLIVDGITHIHIVHPVNDLGWTMRSKGIDQNFVQIDPQAVAAWDYSVGDPFFILSRKSNGLCSLQLGANQCSFTASIAVGVSGEVGFGTMTVTAIGAGALAVGQTINSGNVTGRTSILSQLTGSAGSTGTYRLSQSQTVALTAMTTGVVINNPASRELIQDGDDFLVSSSEPNIWDVS